jgi:hypothetical protein
MKKIAVIVAIWKRQDLEKITLDRLRAQSKKLGFELVVAGSEGEISESLAEGCNYIEVPNDPLSDKHNAMLNKCRELGVEGVVLLGSDDMVNEGYFKALSSFDTESVTGLKDIYFYSTESKKVGHWAGYKEGKQSAGAGRFFPLSVLDKMDWKLWDDGLNSGLDNNCSMRLAEAGIVENIVTMEESGAFLIDIKHTFSISSHAIVEASDQVDASVFQKGVGKKDFGLISALVVVRNKERISGSHLVQFRSNGSYKNLRSGVYELVADIAQLFIDKGYGTIIEG